MPLQSNVATSDSAPCRLVAVVVTYNRLAQLKLTLERLLANPEEHLARVVVVDNASTDGSSAWLKQHQDPRLDVIFCSENSGGAGGFSKGMAHAMEQHAPDWLVVMDDDARPEPYALAAFQAFPRDQWDAVAAAVYFPSGGICEMNRPSCNPFWSCQRFWQTLRYGRNGFHISRDAYQANEICAIDVTSFVGFFISGAGVRRAGLPDPDLFIYGDDALYTLELRRRGGQICFAPQIRFEHDFSTFDSVDQEQRFRPLWKAYYHHRNLLLLYRKAAGWWFWPVLLVILPKWLLKVHHHDGARPVYLKLTLFAIYDGLRQRLDRRHETVRVWADGK